MNLRFSCFQRTLTMTRTSFWKSRAGAGGDEAALFAAELYRMYSNYADSQRWKVEIVSLNETASAVSRKWLPWLRARARTPSLNMRAACTASSVCLETESGGPASIHPLPLWAGMPEAEGSGRAD